MSLNPIRQRPVHQQDQQARQTDQHQCRCNHQNNQTSVFNQNQKTHINVLSSPNYYGKQTAVQRSANAGEAVARMYEQGRYDELANAQIQYADRTNGGPISIDGALAYSRTSMRPLDKNGDGVISAEDGTVDQSLLRMIGGEDGKISNAENAAYTMFMDTLGGGAPDGVITSTESRRGILPQTLRQQAEQARANGDTAKAEEYLAQADELEQQYSEKIQGFVSGLNLEARDQALTMPERSSNPGNMGELGLDRPPSAFNSVSPFNQNNNQSNLIPQAEIFAIPMNMFQQQGQAQNQPSQSNPQTMQLLNLFQQLLSMFLGRSGSF